MQDHRSRREHIQYKAVVGTMLLSLICNVQVWLCADQHSAANQLNDAMSRLHSKKQRYLQAYQFQPHSPAQKTTACLCSDVLTMQERSIVVDCHRALLIAYLLWLLVASSTTPTPTPKAWATAARPRAKAGPPSTEAGATPRGAIAPLPLSWEHL